MTDSSANGAEVQSGALNAPLHLMVDFTGSTAFSRGVIAGVAQYCRERPGIKLRFPSIEWGLIGDPDKVDGVIAMIRDPDTEAAASRFGRPVVNVSSVRFAVPYPTVTMDNAAIGKMAAEHLVRQGYRHFGYVVESRVYFSRARLAGFKDALSAHQQECNVFDTAPPANEPPVGSGLDERESVRRRTLNWLLQLPKPVGLFLHSDVRAAMLLDICQQANLEVPEQVGIVGVDNDELIYPFCTPALTDIDIAADLIGYRAAELAVSLIEGNSPPPHPLLIPPRRLHERASSQPQYIDDECLAAAVQYIRTNIGRTLTMDDVLKVVPVSRRSLERRFQERFRSSPAQFIRTLQLARARDLVLDTTQPLARIALLTGYTRFRNFASAFRKEFGLTPTAFRRKGRVEPVRPG